MSLFDELKRRNVFKVGVAYVVGAWLLAQFSDMLLDNIGAPSWVWQAIMIVMVIGFFITLVVAWAFELTPDGVKREHEVDRSQSVTHKTGRKLDFAIIGLLVLGMGYFVWESRFAEKEPGSSVQAEPIAQEQQANEPAAIEISRQSIAVLPFDNRSRNVDDEYFTEGIHDDLLTNLARIGALKVISRTSVSQYKNTQKTIPQIAAELGVATVMEGAVQRSGNTVRINVQLIDAITDEHLWAEIFDRELTAENLFAIQSEISEKIAHALEATLTPDEEKRINDFPTQSMEAYNAYLRGKQLLPLRNSDDLGRALQEFQQAVAIDPGFALAWVGIAESAVLLGTHGSMSPDERNSIMEAAIEQALAINSQLGEAYNAKGSLLDELNQYDEAEAAYRRAIELSPNYATAYQWYALLLNNSNDRLQESLAMVQKAAQLDPLSPIIKLNIAMLYNRMGRFTEAESAYQLLMTEYPSFSPASLSVGFGLQALNLGQLDKAILSSRKASEIDPGKINTLATEYLYWAVLGDEQRARSVYAQMEALDADHPWLPRAKAMADIIGGRFDAAREEAQFLAQRFSSPNLLRAAGIIFARAGDYERARELLLRTEPGYADRQQWASILNRGDDDTCLVGLTLMRTGDESLGREMLNFAANYWQQTAPLYIQHADRYPSFECYAYLGQVDESIAALQIAFDHGHVFLDWPLYASSPALRIWHEDPRFMAMDQQARGEFTRQRERLAQLETETGP